MDNLLKLIIITPEREFYKGDVKEIITETEKGKLGILPRHVAMITSLSPAVTEITQSDGKKLKAFTSTGTLQVKDNKVSMLCDDCLWPDEVDVKRAEEAKTRAEERLKKVSQDLDVKRAETALKRAIARIKSVKD